MSQSTAELGWADTQWPAYVVFQQKSSDKPHQHAGSVHAPDREMALMNARDVFVRRPPCVSLWVARASNVFARTRQQLEERPGVGDVVQGAAEESETYCVFTKISQKGSCGYIGDVRATSPEFALARAVLEFPNPEALWWWVIPERAIAKTEIDEQESLFEPATRKAFRHQSDFNTLTLMRQISIEPAREDEMDDGS
jgi:ring-1,2-phenylacetyl-CoA epoxidase subunit PaaB